MPSIDQYKQGMPSWLEYMAPDYPKAKEFYAALFDWEYNEIQIGEDPTRDVYGIIRSDGAEIGGMGYQHAEEINAGQPPAWRISFAVDDADATSRAIAEHHGMVVFGPSDVFDQGRFAVAIDPVGAPFAIWEARKRKGADVMMEPNTMLWAELEAHDIDTALSFYSSVFGIETETTSHLNGGYTFLSAGGTRFGGAMKPFADDAPNAWLTYFAVEDVDKSVILARELGATASTEIIEIPFGKFVVMNDPQGATFVMMTPTPQP